MKKRRIRAEYVIIAALLLISFIALAVMYVFREPGGCVVIRVDGIETARYSLDEPGMYELNGGSNILVIVEGKAWLVEADCPDHICIKQGRIAYQGQCITCLPNRLTVTVEGAENEVNGLEIDIISS